MEDVAVEDQKEKIVTQEPQSAILDSQTLRDASHSENAHFEFPVSKPPFLLRAFEVMIGVGGLVFMAPVMVVLAVVIRLGSPGPAVFRQQRIGIGGAPFTFLKFRTHYVDARERFPEFTYDLAEDEVQDFIIQPEEDPRVTKQGKWLRRTSLDELPNLFHLVTGDTALVGPRPEMVEMDRYYKGEMRAKFSVRPGITGLAQIEGRGLLNFHETVAYDLEYVRTRSTWGDIKIIGTTIYRLLTDGEGAH